MDKSYRVVIENVTGHYQYDIQADSPKDAAVKSVSLAEFIIGRTISLSKLHKLIDKVNDNKNLDSRYVSTMTVIDVNGKVNYFAMHL